MKTKIKLLNKKAELPRQVHKTDSGWDLKAIEVKKIVGDVIFFGTGVSIQPPPGFYFEIAPRSSISKLPLSLANSVGIVDETYTGEIQLPIRVLHQAQGQEQQNTTFPGGIVKIFGKQPVSMSTVAQLILTEQPYLCQLILRKKYETEFEVVEELDSTERADGGFGSTDAIISASK